MGDTNKLCLGAGALYLDNVDVGFLKGNVELTYTREKVGFKPANELGEVKRWIISEGATLRATVAELKPANLRLALGINEAIGSSQSYPAYDPSSFSAGADDSFDVIHFGGSKVVDELALRFEHTKADTSEKIILVLYKVVATPEITIPFAEEEVILHDMAFEALHDTSRAAGDQLGFVAEQVQGA